MSGARRRVVITGWEAITPAGASAEDTLAAALAGRSSAAPITRFATDGHPCTFACEIPDGTWGREEVLDERAARRNDRCTQLALVAAARALRSAGLDPSALSDAERSRCAVVAGTGVGGIATLEAQVLRHAARGAPGTSPRLVPMMMVNGPAASIAIAHGFTGPAQCVATACATGTTAIGEGARLVRDGTAEVVVAGGVEAAITPTTLAAFGVMGALSRRNDDPGRASRPFATDRDGFVLGEGVGLVVLEERERALRRGATVLGEVAGYGATSDALHITAPPADGSGSAECLRRALADADLDPQQVGHVNAHGTSTPLNDAAEAAALAAVFGGRAVPVTSTKGTTGHLIGAAGAVEAILALASARAGLVPPVAGTTVVDPAIDAAIDVVIDQPRPIEVRPTVSLSMAFGGHNAALVLLP